MSDPRDDARSAPGDVAAPAEQGARGGGTWCTCHTTAIPAAEGGVIVLWVAGEVDLCTVDLLQNALGTALAQRPGHLVVDLSETGFCSARGLSVLGLAGGTALTRGIGYAVAGASARLNRVWATVWTVAERPVGFSTAADAVLAAMAQQAGSQDRARRRPGPLITTRPGPTAADDRTVEHVPVVPVTEPVALIA